MSNLTDEQLLAEFGEAGFERDGGGGKPWGPVDDSTVEIGILGPMSALRDDPKGWRRFHKIHWGYEMTGRDGQKRKMAFYCVEEKRNGMITRECKQCSKINKQKDEKEAYEADLKRQNRSAEDIRGLLQPLNNWLRRYNCDKKWWFFAMNSAGQFNRFKLSYRTFADLEKEIDALRVKYKMNPLSPKNLIMWNIIRNGSGKNPGTMSEKVEGSTVEKIVEGQIYTQPKAIALTMEQLKKAYSVYEQLGDLSSVKHTLELTPDQISDLSECNEDPDVVTAIVNRTAASAPAARTSTPAPRAAAPAAPQAAPPSMGFSVGTVAEAPAAPAAPAPAPVSAAPAAQAPAPVQTITTTSIAAPLPIDDMTEDEIFAKLGMKREDLKTA